MRIARAFLRSRSRADLQEWSVRAVQRRYREHLQPSLEKPYNTRGISSSYDDLSESRREDDVQEDSEAPTDMKQEAASTSKKHTRKAGPTKSKRRVPNLHCYPRASPTLNIDQSNAADAEAATGSLGVRADRQTAQASKDQHAAAGDRGHFDSAKDAGDVNQMQVEVTSTELGSGRIGRAFTLLGPLAAR